MADILFDEDQEFRRRAVIERKPYFVRLVLATGLVSTEQQANYVLLGVAALLIFLAFSIPAFTKPSSAKVPQSVIDATMKTPSGYQR